MITNLDPASQRFLADLNRIQLKTAVAQQQLSSGLKVQAASDAPDQIGDLLQLASRLAANTQTAKNLNRVQAETTAADNALTAAVQLLDKLTQVAGQVLSSGASQNRASAVEQIQDLEEQIVALTSTSAEGRYVFGGDSASGAPYQFDASAPNGVVRLQSTPATRVVQDAGGDHFPYARSAPDIFDHRDSSDQPDADNIFAAIGAATAAINADDQTALTAAIDGLHRVAGYLGSQQAFYGSILNRVSSSLTAAQSLGTSLEIQIGSIRSADLTEASLALSAGNIQLQAALSARAASQSKTLFDYLG